MSWDVSLQHLPADAESVEDVPDGCRPQPIGPRECIIATIAEVAPQCGFSDPTLGVIQRRRIVIEVGIGPEDPRTGLATHTRGGGLAAAIADILGALDLRVLDPRAPGWHLQSGSIRRVVRKRQQYRDEVIE